MEVVHRLSADAAESGHPVQPPDPEEAETYAHKPLPPLPSSSYFRRSQSSTRMVSGPQHTSPDHNAESPHDLPLSTCSPPSTSPPRHYSMSQTATTKHNATNRRYSRKILQITGQEVEMTETSPYRPARTTIPSSMETLSDSGWAAFAGSAALRMGFLDQKDEGSPVPPLLEVDRDGSAKSHDSWEPVSPGSAQPAPWMTDAEVAEAQHDADFMGHVRSASSESDSKVRGLFNLHSTDFEVAWSYHTIATELAIPKRPTTSHVVQDSSGQASPAKTARFSKILHSDSPRRLRNTLPAIITSPEPRPVSRHREKPLPRISHLGPSNTTPIIAPCAIQAIAPQSAFDESDSEDDEGGDQSRWGASPALVKDWLARKSGDGGSRGHSPTARSSQVRRPAELSKPSLRSKPSAHLRGLLAGAKDKARASTWSRAE